MTLLCLAPGLTQGDTQMALQPSSDGGLMGGGSVQSFRSVPSSMLDGSKAGRVTVAVCFSWGVTGLGNPVPLGLRAQGQQVFLRGTKYPVGL